MNRYETTLTLTVSLKAKDETAARELLEQVAAALYSRGPRTRASAQITYVQGGDEFDCMEVEVDG